MYGKGRKVFYSSFHPDAVDLLRKLQTEYPVCTFDTFVFFHSFPLTLGKGKVIIYTISGKSH